MHFTTVKITNLKEIKKKLLLNLSFKLFIFSNFGGELSTCIVEQFYVFLLNKMTVFYCRLELLLQRCIFVLQSVTDTTQI